MLRQLSLLFAPVTGVHVLTTTRMNPAYDCHENGGIASAGYSPQFCAQVPDAATHGRTVGYKCTGGRPGGSLTGICCKPGFGPTVIFPHDGSLTATCTTLGDPTGVVVPPQPPGGVGVGAYPMAVCTPTGSAATDHDCTVRDNGHGQGHNYSYTCTDPKYACCPAGTPDIVTVTTPNNVCRRAAAAPGAAPSVRVAGVVMGGKRFS